MSEQKKLSEELDEETLALIVRGYVYADSHGSTGNCESCGITLNGSAYDVVHQGERFCQVCKILGMRGKGRRV